MGRTATIVIAAGLALVAACGSDAGTAADPVVEAAGDAATGDTVGDTADDTAGERESSTTIGGAAEAGGELFPDVVAASAEREADGSWTFSATLSSPYDTAERYADAWRVIGPDSEVYGVRELAHDHRAEQPFTRSQGGIEIPEGVEVVTVQGRDQVSGWGGDTVEVQLER